MKNLLPALAAALPAVALSAALPLLAAAAPSAGRFAKMDRHALATPKSAETSLRSLAKYLIRPAKTDLEKARAIYRWITANVAYDADAYYSGSYRNQSRRVEDVLRSRSAVCDGYSGVFERLGGLAGLEVAKISGFAKGAGYRLGQSFAGEQPNHAWNAVKIGGRWRLLDSTWGAGHVSSDKKAFVREFRDEYFLTPPEQFISAHYPEQAQWQLLKNPLSRREFEERVYVRPEFFSNGLELASHRAGRIAAPERLAVRLKLPAGAALSAGLLRAGKKLDPTLVYVRPAEGGATVHALFPRPGAYTLRIFSKRRPRDEVYQWSLDYLVQANKGTSSRFPDFRPPFFSDGLELISHRDGVIETGAEVTVKLATPADVGLVAELLRGESKLPRHLTFVQRQGRATAVSAHFPRAGSYTLRIFSKKGRSTKEYQWAVDYRVKAARGLGKRAGFPTIFTPFLSEGAHLVEPLAGVLPAGKTVRFALRVPRAEKVAVIVGKKWHFLVRKGERFEGEVPVAKGEVGVFAKLPGGKGFAGLLGYRGM